MPLPSYNTTIGTYYLRGWSGWIPDMQDQVESFARLGQTGSGGQILCKRGREVECSGWDAFDTKTLATTATSNFELLQGQELNITDQWGFVTKVRVMACTATIRAVRGLAPFLVEVRMRLEPLGPA